MSEPWELDENAELMDDDSADGRDITNSPAGDYNLIK